LYDLSLKGIPNMAEIIVRMKPAEITNCSTCRINTKNFITNGRIQMISPEEIQRVECHSKGFFFLLLKLLFLNLSNGDSVKLIA
jgi:hypothetical protein